MSSWVSCGRVETPQVDPEPCVPRPRRRAVYRLGENAESTSDNSQTHSAGSNDGQPVEVPSAGRSVLSTGGGASRGARSAARGRPGSRRVDGVGHIGGERRGCAGDGEDYCQIRWDTEGR